VGIEYREDDDLAFLQYASEDNLRILSRYLAYDSGGKVYLTSELLDNAQFKERNGDDDQYRRSWKLIAGELQLFGGNTIVNAVRGYGVKYNEIIRDVLQEKFDLTFSKNENAYEMEDRFLLICVGKAWSLMDDETRKRLARDLFLENCKIDPQDLFGVLFGRPLSQLISLRLSTIVANSFSSSLLFNDQITRYIKIPLAFDVVQMTGPAFRVTIPAVAQIAYMRREMEDHKRFK
jgi:uncharacterized protein YaaW (UPF0174 family)